MAPFLSPAWLEQVEAAASGSEQLRRAAGQVELSVGQVVEGGPDGDVSYSVRLARGTVSVAPGGADQADIEVASDYATAASISKGELSPAVALAAGRLRLTGRVGLLAEHKEVLAGLSDLMAPVRATTEY